MKYINTHVFAGHVGGHPELHIRCAVENWLLLACAKREQGYLQIGVGADGLARVYVPRKQNGLACSGPTLLYALVAAALAVAMETAH